MMRFLPFLGLFFERAAAVKFLDSASSEESQTLSGVERAAGLGNTKLFVYAPKFKNQNELSLWFSNLTAAAERSPRKTNDPAEADVFFLGIETCCDINWPSYGAQLTSSENYVMGTPQSCHDTRPKRLEDYLVHDAVNFQLDGSSHKQAKYKRRGYHLAPECRSYSEIPDAHKQNRQPLVYTAPSFGFHDGNFIQGLYVATPAMPLANLSPLGGVVECGRTKYLAVFKGTDDHPTRHRMKALDNGRDMRIDLRSGRIPCVSKSCGEDDGYKELMENAKFSFVVRGDALYSYRLLEAMSAGTIPIVLSDDWVLPFYEAIDYSKFAVLIDEAKLEKAEAVLRSMPDKKVCEMRKEAYRVYKAHMQTFDLQLETLMQVFDRRQAGTTFASPKALFVA